MGVGNVWEDIRKDFKNVWKLYKHLEIIDMVQETIIIVSWGVDVELKEEKLMG